jgi:hypothetical protein
VRLHHSDAFAQEDLWRYAADFKTNAGKQLGVKLTRRAPGVGDLEACFDPTVSVEEKIIFSKYVREHLLQHARDVERLRHYVCPQCGTPVGNREVAMQRLNDWLQGRPPQPESWSGFKFRKGKEEPPSIICAGCEQRVPLWDEMEQCFASPEIQQRVRDLQEEPGQCRSPKSEIRNKSEARNPKHRCLATGSSVFGFRASFGLRHSAFDFQRGIPRAAGDPECRGRNPLDGSARLAEARERQRSEAGEADRLRGRAVQCDERAAVAGAGAGRQVARQARQGARE